METKNTQYRLAAAVADEATKQQANRNKHMKTRLVNYDLSLPTAGAALFSTIAPAQAADKKPNILVSAPPLSPLQATQEVDMFTRMVSMRSPFIVRHSRNASNLSTEGIGSAFEQNEEFAKWWEQWVRRVQQTRANARKFTINA